MFEQRFHVLCNAALFVNWYGIDMYGVRTRDCE